MTFEDFWAEVCKTKRLTDGENQLIPTSLSDKTKNRIMKLSPETVADLLKECIKEVYSGSTENIDTLLNKKLGED